MEYKGNIVDIIKRRVYKGKIIVENDKIVNVVECEIDSEKFIIPGFVDSHVHIESSMLVPVQIAKFAMKHGTVSVVTDPHEIANVVGEEGVNYMVDNAKFSPLKFYFGVPSCVPATTFETAGATIDLETTKRLIKRKEFVCLSEMMNIPGVLNSDKNVTERIRITKEAGKPTDGHAPGMTGEPVIKYSKAGISTDHECSTYEEAVFKINQGMNILIREGSAAKDFEQLYPLIDEFPDKVMFCTDDTHPDDLQKRHINNHVKRAVAKGCDLFNVLRAASLNPVKHYKLNVGLLQKGDLADFVIVDNLTDFNIKETYINGEKCFLVDKESDKNTVNLINNFEVSKIELEDIQIKKMSDNMNVILSEDGLLFTKKIMVEPFTESGYVVSDTKNDILKIVVLNRYDKNAKPVVGFIKGFGLKNGAMGQSIAHDSHNIIAVGVTDEDIVEVINSIIEEKGAIAVKTSEKIEVLPLPVAGIISNLDADTLAKRYENINKQALSSGTKLTSPLMTLSFMALLVIPEFKIGDKGLFSSDKFELVELFNNTK